MGKMPRLKRGCGLEEVSRGDRSATAAGNYRPTSAFRGATQEAAQAGGEHDPTATKIVPANGKGKPTTMPARIALNNPFQGASPPNRRSMKNAPPPPSRKPRTTSTGIASPTVSRSCEKRSQSRPRIHKPVSGNRNCLGRGSTSQRHKLSRSVGLADAAGVVLWTAISVMAEPCWFAAATTPKTGRRSDN